jgi:hypothetical protein
MSGINFDNCQYWRGKSMGMYTELVASFELKENAPKQVLDILTHMTVYSEQTVDVPDHPFFKCERWHFMLRCSSAYFVGAAHSTLQHSEVYDCYSLLVHCNFKNYENELDLFLNWLAPYVKRRGFAGYSRYEEDVQPKLIYCVEDGKIERLPLNEVRKIELIW